MHLAVIRKLPPGAGAPAALIDCPPTGSQPPHSLSTDASSLPGAWVLRSPTSPEAGAWWTWREEVWEDVRP